MKRLPFGLRVAAGLTVTAAEQARTLPTKLVGLPITVLSETLQLSMRVQQHLTELAIRGDGALSSLRPVEQAPAWATFDEDLLDSEIDTETGPGDEPGEHPEVAELRADLLRLDRRGTAALTPWQADHRGANGSGAVIPAARSAAPEQATEQPTDQATEQPTERTADQTAERPDDIVDDPWEQEQRALAADHEPGEFDTTPAGAPETTPTAATPTETARAEPDDGTPAPPQAFRNYPELSIPQLRARLRRFSLADLEELLAYERATADREDYVRMLTNRIDTVRGDQ